MPQVTVYIREDDLDKWKTLEKKSEWLSNQLNKEQHPLIKVKMPTLVHKSPDKITPKIIKTPKEAKKATAKVRKDSPEALGYISKSYSARKKDSKLKYEEDL